MNPDIFSELPSKTCGLATSVFDSVLGQGIFYPLLILSCIATSYSCCFLMMACKLCWLIVYSGGKSGESDDECRDGVSCRDIYNGSTELVLVSLLDLYLLLKSISVGASELSPCLTSYYLLTT